MSAGLGPFGTTEHQNTKQEDVVIEKSRTVTANYIKTHQREEHIFSEGFSLAEAKLLSLGLSLLCVNNALVRILVISSRGDTLMCPFPSPGPPAGT